MQDNIDNRLVLERILLNIGNIQTLMKTTTKESFLSELKDFNAICLELIQIGEKVNQLNPDFCDSHPDVPWHELYGLRNRIVHGYEKVRKEIIWATITDDLPQIQESINDILQNKN